MKAKDIMSKDVEIVSPDTLLHDVAKKMFKSDCGSVLIAEDDRLVGIITDRDMALRCVAESHHPEDTKAEQIMSKEILYCRESDEIEDVVLNMTQNKVRRLAVLDEKKKLVGIISLGDVAVHCTDEHHRICGKALGAICASKAQDRKKASYAY